MLYHMVWYRAAWYDTIIDDRSAYRRVAREGKAVYELWPPDRQASPECALCYEEVFDAP